MFEMFTLSSNFIEPTGSSASQSQILPGPRRPAARLAPHSRLSNTQLGGNMATQISKQLYSDNTWQVGGHILTTNGTETTLLLNGLTDVPAGQRPVIESVSLALDPAPSIDTPISFVCNAKSYKFNAPGLFYRSVDVDNYRLSAGAPAGLCFEPGHDLSLAIVDNGAHELRVWIRGRFEASPAAASMGGVFPQTASYAWDNRFMVSCHATDVAPNVDVVVVPKGVGISVEEIISLTDSSLDYTGGLIAISNPDIAAAIELAHLPTAFVQIGAQPAFFRPRGLRSPVLSEGQTLTISAYGLGEGHSRDFIVMGHLLSSS